MHTYINRHNQQVTLLDETGDICPYWYVSRTDWSWIREPPNNVFLSSKWDIKIHVSTQHSVYDHRNIFRSNSSFKPLGANLLQIPHFSETRHSHNVLVLSFIVIVSVCSSKWTKWTLDHCYYVYISMVDVPFCTRYGDLFIKYVCF